MNFSGITVQLSPSKLTHVAIVSFNVLAAIILLAKGVLYLDWVCMTAAFSLVFFAVIFYNYGPTKSPLINLFYFWFITFVTFPLKFFLLMDGPRILGERVGFTWYGENEGHNFDPIEPGGSLSISIVFFSVCIFAFWLGLSRGRDAKNEPDVNTVPRVNISALIFITLFLVLIQNALSPIVSTGLVHQFPDALRKALFILLTIFSTDVFVMVSGFLVFNQLLFSEDRQGAKQLFFFWLLSFGLIGLGEAIFQSSRSFFLVWLNFGVLLSLYLVEKNRGYLRYRLRLTSVAFYTFSFLALVLFTFMLADAAKQQYHSYFDASGFKEHFGFIDFVSSFTLGFWTTFIELSIISEVVIKIMIRFFDGGLDSIFLLNHKLIESQLDSHPFNRLDFTSYLFKASLNQILPGTPYPQQFMPSSSLFSYMISSTPLNVNIEDPELIYRRMNNRPYTLFGLAVIYGGWLAPLILYLFAISLNWIERRLGAALLLLALYFIYVHLIAAYNVEKLPVEIILVSLNVYFYAHFLKSRSNE